MTTPLTKKESQQDAATQQIAREAAAEIARNEIVHGNYAHIVLMATPIILSAIERATEANYGVVKICLCGHNEIQYCRFSDHDECTVDECECDRFIAAQPQPSKARKEQAPRAQGSPTPRNPCPISYSHLPHDYCDGKPTAPAIGSPASGERSEQPKCTCETYDPRGAIRDPDCQVHDEYGEERPQRPRGQQQEWSIEDHTDESGGLFLVITGFKLWFPSSCLHELEGTIAAHNAAIERYKEKAWKYDQLRK